MAETATHISYEEFANNLSEFFDRVARQNETIVIEKDGNESVVLKPAPAEARPKRERTEADHEAFLSSAGGWSDFDVDTFLEYIYERRNSPSRPPVEL